jgi:hypothetical protein
MNRGVPCGGGVGSWGGEGVSNRCEGTVGECVEKVRVRDEWGRKRGHADDATESTLRETLGSETTIDE